MKKLLRKFKRHMEVCDRIGISGCIEICNASQGEVDEVSLTIQTWLHVKKIMVLTFNVQEI
jgi:hypothetical protein